MNIELSLLIWSAVLTWVMILTASMIRTQSWTPAGLVVAMQNRDNLPEPTALFGRADRAAKNMLENVLLFAILVLGAQAAGVSTENTVLGAHLFFWARLAFFPVYLIGIPYLRTLLWFVAWIGMVVILVEIL